VTETYLNTALEYERGGNLHNFFYQLMFI